MINFAIKQIKYDALRYGLIIFAISASIAMILILRGFEQGLYDQSRRVVMDRGGALILAQKGVSNFLAVRSSIPQLTRGEVEAIEGVKEAHPVTSFWVIYGPEGNKLPVMLLVFDTLGGPTHLVKGLPVRNSRDVVIDKALSQRFGLEPGDPLIISDYEFRVSGITSGSSALFSTIAYVSYDGMIDLFLESEIAPDISTFPLLSFLLVEIIASADREKVAKSIQQKVKDVDVFMPETLANKDVKLGQELFGPVMNVLVILSFIIGLLVIGLIVYSDVSSRLRSYAVMKALGFDLKHIIYSVFTQTLMLVLIAFPLGIAIAQTVSRGIEYSMPIYKVQVMEPASLLYVLAGVIVMLVLANLLPIRMLATTDPVTAFQQE